MPSWIILGHDYCILFRKCASKSAQHRQRAVAGPQLCPSGTAVFYKQLALLHQLSTGLGSNDVLGALGASHGHDA